MCSYARTNREHDLTSKILLINSSEHCSDALTLTAYEVLIILSSYYTQYIYSMKSKFRRRLVKAIKRQQVLKMTSKNLRYVFVTRTVLLKLLMNPLL
jgi:hypothetical protein